MTKVLGFGFSDYELVEYEDIPTMQVKHWSSDNSYSLSPEWSTRQMMYSNFFRLMGDIPKKICKIWQMSLTVTLT